MNSVFKKCCTILVSVAIMFSLVAGSGIQVNADEALIEGFVTRLYNLILEREADESGLNYWVSEFESGRTAASVVDYFYNSNEMTSRNLTNEEFIDITYRALLDREAEEDGKASWLSYLESGESTRQDILICFVEAPEFGALCETYGITKGSLVPETVLSPKEQFISNLYINILNRKPADSEISAWVNTLNNGKTAADLITSFFGSSEFSANALSNEQYVATCYRAILGREAASSEIAGWVNNLNSGMTKTKLLANFVNSSEFTAMCATAGITRGSISTQFVSSLDDSRLSAQQRFVKKCYNALYDRDPIQSELTYWANKLSNGITAASFLQTLTGSQSYKGKNVSNSDFVEDIFLATIGRTPDAYSRNVWTNRLNTNYAKYSLINFLVTSTEFKNLCSSYGIEAGYVDLTGTGNWTYVNGQKVLIDVETGYKANCGWAFVDGWRLYFTSDGYMSQNTSSILGGQSEYYLTVDTTANIVMVYARTYAGGAFDTPVMAMLCSCGVAGNDTIKGTFTLRPIGRWHILMGDVWGQYCTQISGNYLFHSVWYYQQGNIRTITVSGFNQLGSNASHGCVRLSVCDAMWIYNNCGGSKVNVAYHQVQPFDRPAKYYAVSVGGDYGYDPHDPGL